MKHLQTLHTQDNLATEHPLFVVYDRQRIYGADSDDGSYEWKDEDFGSPSEEEVAELDKKADEDCDLAESYETEDGTSYKKVPYLEVRKFVTACFTRAAADEFMETQSHHLENPFIYVESLWRNREMIEVRQHLMATHRPQSPWQPAKK